MKSIKDYIKDNQAAWDLRAAVHTQKDSDSYNITGFIEGQSTLEAIELSELGDVTGKSMLHLQCHFGLDTLSWAREGAAEVTGVDFSPKAIAYAEQLAKQCQIDNVNFICSDILQLRQHLDKKYDIVYASHGVLNWIPDINQWAEIAAHYLKPSGCFYIVEFHPLINMFNADFSELSWPYFYKDKRQPLIMDEDVSYANQDIECKHTTAEWPHTFGEVITALQQAGLNIDYVHEFSYIPFECFDNLEEIEAGKFVFKGHANLPLMYSIRAIA